MKTRPALILAVLLILLPVFTSCNLFGKSNEERNQERLEAYQQQLEAYQKEQDKYYQNLQNALNDYSKAYAEWQQQELQNKLQQVPGGAVVIVTENQTQP